MQQINLLAACLPRSVFRRDLHCAAAVFFSLPVCKFITSVPFLQLHFFLSFFKRKLSHSSPCALCSLPPSLPPLPANPPLAAHFEIYEFLNIIFLIFLRRGDTFSFQPFSFFTSFPPSWVNLPDRMWGDSVAPWRLGWWWWSLVCVWRRGFRVEVEHSGSTLFPIQYYTWPRETQGNTFSFFGEARSGIKRVFERLLGASVSYPARPTRHFLDFFFFIFFFCPFPQLHSVKNRHCGAGALLNTLGLKPKVD